MRKSKSITGQNKCHFFVSGAKDVAEHFWQILAGLLCPARLALERTHKQDFLKLKFFLYSVLL